MKLLVGSLRGYLTHEPLSPETIEACLDQIAHQIDATAALAQDVRHGRAQFGLAQPAPERHGVSRILVVDDEPSVLEVLATLLADGGMRSRPRPMAASRWR